VATTSVIVKPFCAPTFQLVENPGFEDGSLSPFEKFGSNAGTISLVNSNSLCHTGDYCVEAVGGTSGGNPVVTMEFPVCPGHTYTFSAWARGGNSNAPNCFIEWSSLETLTPNVGNSGKELCFTDFYVTGEEWTQCTATYTVSSNAVTVDIFGEIYCTGGSSALDVYFDDVTLTLNT
jgi:hypothetical protein